MNKIHFTQSQITQFLGEIASGENGFNDVLKIALEALMLGEREVYNDEHKESSNGYRRRRAFGEGQVRSPPPYG